jgi:hypothetical protein
MPELHTERHIKLNVKEEYVVCSELPFPFIKPYCAKGYYVSLAFTANEYYVLVKPKGKSIFLAYAVSLVENKNEVPYFRCVEDSELDEIKKTLKQASKYDLVKYFKDLTMYKGKVFPVIINGVDKLDPQTVEAMREAVEVGIDVTELNEETKESETAKLAKQIKPFIDLYLTPNVVVYPFTYPQYAEMTEPIEFATDHICLKDHPYACADVPILDEFDNEYYKQTITAEIINTVINKKQRESGKEIGTRKQRGYLTFYLAYGVSRPIEYRPSGT